MKNPNDTPDATLAETRRAAAFDEQIAALEADRRPATETLDPADQDALMLARHLVATSRSAQPDASFVAELEQRLLAGFSSQRSPNIPTTPPPRRASRRALLGGGLTLAAGLTGGILVERAIHQPDASTTAQGPWPLPLVGADGTWLAVAHVSGFSLGTVQRFTTPQLVGHLLRRANGTFAAFSAACTHMGCLVTWNGPQRTFDCPCHSGRFDAQGIALPGQRIAYRPLPTIMTKIEGDTVLVYVPASITTSPPTIDPSYHEGH